jgi:hypothetical protein
MQPQGYGQIPRPEETQHQEISKTNGHAAKDGTGDEETGNRE